MLFFVWLFSFLGLIDFAHMYDVEHGSMQSKIGMGACAFLFVAMCIYYATEWLNGKYHK